MRKLILLITLALSPLSFAAVDHAQFERYVEKMMAEFHTPGVAVGVVSKSGPLYMKGFGVRGVNEKRPVTPDTQFAIGSTSKAFTATSIGILVDQKRLEWDKPVKSNYLPDFKMFDPFSTELVTVRDLLTHRTGLPRHDFAWYGTPFTREEIYRKIQFLTPTAGLREKAQYQNIMFMVAGYLVGKIANTSWEDFVAKNIFEKLDMRNSNFSTEDIQKAADFAYPHSNLNGNVQQIPFRNLDAVGPAGSINSSVRDMGKWLQMQLNAGQVNGVQIVSKETLAEIQKPQMLSSIMAFDKIFSELGPETYAMGWFSQPYLNKTLVHHGGGIDGFITFVGFLPELDTGIVVVGNAGGLVPYIAAFAYMDLMIKGNIGPWEERVKKLMAPKPANFVESSAAPLPLAAYAGTYSHPAYGEILVSVNEQAASLDFVHYAVKYNLGHRAEHAFLPIADGTKLDGNTPPITFTLDPNGQISGLKYKADEVADPIVFTR